MAETEGIALARRVGYRRRGLPCTVVIDRQGETAKGVVGMPYEQKLELVVDSFLY